MAQARTNGKTEITDLTAQIDTIKQDMSTLTALMSEMAKEKKDAAALEAKSKANAVTASAAKSVDAAQARAIETGEKLYSDAEAAYYKAEDTVREQPAMAVGLAAGLGFIVGMMTARRS